MCTAIIYLNRDFYFGRNLDVEFDLKDEVVICPRNFTLLFKKKKKITRHYAFIGMAYVYKGYPLYYDAINEKGLGAAGLNFKVNATYFVQKKNKDNITPYEFIPWILSQCASVKEVKALIQKMNFLNVPYSEELPLPELHFLIADKDQSIVVEPMKEGIKIYDNPVGVLTNNPPFPYQLFQLNQYRHLSNKTPENSFSKTLDLDIYCKGLGGVGLPGDLTSQSRFIRAAFVKLNSISNVGLSSVSQFFHILHSVEQQRGCSRLEKEQNEITVYSSCCNVTKGIYYYTTYENHQIRAINMHNENLDGSQIICYPITKEEQIYFEN